MCYAIPGRVIGFENNLVVIDYFGQHKKARNELPALKSGDYIYAQGGYVIEILPRKKALSILDIWKETFFELEERDLELCRLKLEKTAVEAEFLKILDRVLAGSRLKKSELGYLLAVQNEPEQNLLYRVGNFLRQKYHGNSCCVHGIIEFSNYCQQACHYCGISTNNRNLSRYRMAPEEIINAAVLAVEKYGFKSLVLQSGEDPAFSLEDLSKMVTEIRRRAAVLIFISCGEIGLAGLAQLYAAGARGLLLRFETSNQQIYQRLRPNCSLETRLNHLREAKKIGYLIATGALIGLPGQTSEDILNDLLLTRELQPDMYSFGPFLPHPDTPLAGEKPPVPEEVLKTLAVARIADPVKSRLVVATAFETLYQPALRAGLISGANSLMLILTPDKYRKQYQIYPGRPHAGESISQQIKKTLDILRDLGRAPTDLGLDF